MKPLANFSADSSNRKLTIVRKTSIDEHSREERPRVDVVFLAISDRPCFEFYTSDTLSKSPFSMDPIHGENGLFLS